MAHKGGSGGGGQGGGIESITPKVGMVTALGMLVLTLGIGWVIAKDPRAAAKALLLLPVLLVLCGGHPSNHPLIFVIGGCSIAWWATGHNRD